MLMLQVLQEHVRARVQADDRRRLRSREGPHSRPPVPRPNVRSLRIALCIYRLPSTRTATLLYSPLYSGGARARARARARAVCRRWIVAHLHKQLRPFIRTVLPSFGASDFQFLHRNNRIVYT